MRVAVLMSTYNGEKYLQQQLDSILKQTGGFEVDIWVRDDGSTDNTHRILKEYEKNGKLRWYTGNNLGPALSFISLVKKCVGYDFYAFADQDDYWLPGKLQQAIKVLERQFKPALYLANARLVDANLNDLRTNVYKSNPKVDFCTLVCAGGLIGGTMVFNHLLAEKLQTKPLPAKIVMHDFYLALVCLIEEGSIFYDDIPYIKYRQHGNNVVGVSYGIVGKIRARFHDITKRAAVSIADQAGELADSYGERMEGTKYQWLIYVSHYRKNIITRLKMALSFKVRYISLNMGLKNRIAIFLGNR